MPNAPEFGPCWKRWARWGPLDHQKCGRTVKGSPALSVKAPARHAKCPRIRAVLEALGKMGTPRSSEVRKNRKRFSRTLGEGPCPSCQMPQNSGRAGSAGQDGDPSI